VDAADAAPVPAFLAGRSSRPAPPPEAAKQGRDEVVPSWELTDRYGAGGNVREPSDNNVARQVMTAIAVVFIIGLGVAAVILIPGLLNGSPTSTPRSFAIPSRSATAGASAVAALPTPTRTPAATPTSEPTIAATPEPTPRLYKIKVGDTMAKIARKFNLTVEQILAANPEIPDANHIEVGQFIIIPIALSST
jgi:LysM repeat protein